MKTIRIGEKNAVSTETLYPLVIIAIAAAIGVALLVRRGGNTRMDDAIGKLSQSQIELAARIGQLTEQQTAAQAELNRTLDQRLETVGKRLGDGLTQHTEKTGKTMTEIHERLAVIDSAQKNLTELSANVMGLQDILTNKQRRGAFGQIQLEDLVRDTLPPSAYGFEVTLSNGRRADCMIKLPNPPGPIAIDSKFPLEAYRALQEADDDDQRKVAARAFTTDLSKHVKDISDRYIIPGETADWALMFVPSEAVYAEAHANFPNVIDDAHKRRVAIVSPTTMMATLNTVRAVLKDARIREQAGVIQAEVATLLVDVVRLDTRVEDLQKHFGQASKDIDKIRTSTDKVIKRGGRIDSVQLGDDTPADDLLPDDKPPTGTLGADADLLTDNEDT